MTVSNVSIASVPLSFAPAAWPDVAPIFASRTQIEMTGRALRPGLSAQRYLLP
jgi:hypothetical protein